MQRTQYLKDKNNETAKQDGCNGSVKQGDSRLRADEGHATEAREPKAPCWNHAPDTKIRSHQKNPKKGCERLDIFLQVSFHFRIHAGTHLFLNSAICLVGKSRKNRMTPSKEKDSEEQLSEF